MIAARSPGTAGRTVSLEVAPLMPLRLFASAAAQANGQTWQQQMAINRSLHPSGEQYEIFFGDQRAVITEVGATLREYWSGSRSVLEGFAVSEMCSGGRGQLLMPWPNRIREGSYEFIGRR